MTQSPKSPLIAIQANQKKESLRQRLHGYLQLGLRLFRFAEGNPTYKPAPDRFKVEDSGLPDTLKQDLETKVIDLENIQRSINPSIELAHISKQLLPFLRQLKDAQINRNEKLLLKLSSQNLNHAENKSFKESIENKIVYEAFRLGITVQFGNDISIGNEEYQKIVSELTGTDLIEEGEPPFHTYKYSKPDFQLKIEIENDESSDHNWSSGKYSQIIYNISLES